MKHVYIVFEYDSDDGYLVPSINRVLSDEKEALLQAWTYAFKYWYNTYTVEEWWVDSERHVPQKTTRIDSQQLKKTLVPETLADIELEMLQTRSIPERLRPFIHATVH